MKIKVSGQSEITLTTAMTEYSPTPDAQETDITCVADVAGSLVGKYFKLYSANNAAKYAIYYDIASTAQVSTYTTVANVASGLGGKHFTFFDGNSKPYVTWMNVGEAEVNTLTCGTAAQTTMTGEKEKNTLSTGTAAQTDMTGEKEKNTLTCGTAAQTTMTGTKEVNTITSEADIAGSLNNETFHFFSLDANNGTKTEYYCWFNVDSGGADPQEPLGSPIEVTISSGDTANDVATAVRTAINTYGADVAVTGATDQIIITGDYFGIAEACADGWSSPTGWSSFVRTTSGVDITAGEYFTIVAGITTPVTYYAWFNATGGSAAGTAPSIDPSVSGATGIQVDHAHDADANAMGTALRAALEAAIGATGTGVTVITGATTDAIIEDAEYGLGTAATESFANGAFSAARINTGVDITAGEYFTFVSSGTTYYTWFNATGGSADDEAGSTDPAVPSATGIQVDHAHDANADAVALALRTAVDAAVTTVTVTGATNACIIEENSYGLGTAATESITDANFTVARTNTGVAITAGDYFTFTTGLTGSEDEYYAWFNATGGAADNEAGSIEPSPVAGTGIQVNHAFDANSTQMGTALRAAIEAVVGATGDASTVISGSTTDVIITNILNGVGVAAASANVNFTAARTNTGVASSTQPTGYPSTTEFTEVDLTTDDTDEEVATAIRTALNANSDVTSMFTITGATDAVIVTADDAGPLKTAVVNDSGFSVTETTEGWVDATTNDPAVSGFTSKKVTIIPNETDDNVAEKTKDVIHGLDEFSATRSSEVISVVDAGNGECTTAHEDDLSGLDPGFTYEVTTSGVTGVVAGTSYKIFKLIGTQEDPTNFNIPKDVTVIASESEIEYIKEGF